ncbi:MAG: hypothetical protein ABII01_00540 [Candidatus Woesearchaeota archaeon]
MSKGKKSREQREYHASLVLRLSFTHPFNKYRDGTDRHTLFMDNSLYRRTNDNFLNLDDELQRTFGNSDLSNVDSDVAQKVADIERKWEYDTGYRTFTFVSQQTQ